MPTLTTQSGLGEQDRIQALVNAILKLEENVTNREFGSSDFARVLQILEALPIDSSSYSLMKCRIRNAWQNAVTGETGAATYELGLVRRPLQKQRGS